jgi:hypothetical protein
MIQVFRVEIAIAVENPGHLALGGAHVWSRHILSGADVPAPNQFPGEAPGDSLERCRVVLSRIDAQAALGSTERNIDQGTLVGHQRRQRLGMILIHVGGKSQPSLDWQTMGRVDGSPSREDFQTSVNAHGEADLHHRGTSLQRIGGTLRYVQQRHGVFDHACHTVSKSLVWNRVRHGASPGSVFRRGQGSRRCNEGHCDDARRYPAAYGIPL